mgnify:CR=1 FL=1
MYEAKRKRAATLSSIGSGIGVFLLLLGIAAIIAGVGLNNMFWVVLGAMMFLFGDGWISGSKLLYWTFNTRIQVERDIKVAQRIHHRAVEVNDGGVEMRAVKHGRGHQRASSTRMASITAL